MNNNIQINPFNNINMNQQNIQNQIGAMDQNLNNLIEILQNKLNQLMLLKNQLNQINPMKNNINNIIPNNNIQINSNFDNFDTNLLNQTLAQNGQNEMKNLFIAGITFPHPAGLLNCGQSSYLNATIECLIIYIFIILILL